MKNLWPRLEKKDGSTLTWAGVTNLEYPGLGGVDDEENPSLFRSNWLIHVGLTGLCISNQLGHPTYVGLSYDTLRATLTYAREEDWGTPAWTRVDFWITLACDGEGF